MSTSPAIVEPPPATELIALVAAFLRQDVVPIISDAKLRYRVRAAEHLLQLAQRELGFDGNLRRDEDGYLITDRMMERFGSLKRLSDGLYAGKLDVASNDILSLLEEFVIEKIRIAAPETLDPSERGGLKG
jgi:hypothetical protein